MSYEFSEFDAESLVRSAENAYFSDWAMPALTPDYADHCGGDRNWGSYFDQMSSFDSDDYEYQQGLVCR